MGNKIHHATTSCGFQEKFEKKITPTIFPNETGRIRPFPSKIMKLFRRLVPQFCHGAGKTGWLFVINDGMDQNTRQWSRRMCGCPSHTLNLLPPFRILKTHPDFFCQTHDIFWETGRQRLEQEKIGL